MGAETFIHKSLISSNLFSNILSSLNCVIVLIKDLSIFVIFLSENVIKNLMICPFWVGFSFKN